MKKYKKQPRFTVHAGRDIYRDGVHFFTVDAPTSLVGPRPVVSPCEADELTHIICALLNRLGSRSIVTTYLGTEQLLKLRSTKG